MNELNKARLSLDETESMMRQIADDRRTRSGTENAWKGLNWIGYTSIVLLILRVLYKCGVLQLLKYIPGKICDMHRE